MQINLDKNIVYNIYLVKTPFQFINAYEALDYFKTKNNILIIVDNGVENNKIQLTNLIEVNYWDEIIRFGDKSKSNFINYIRLIRMLKKIKIENFFASSGLKKMQQVIFANIKAKNICLIDQGVGTIYTYNLFKNNNFKNINAFNIKKLRFNLLGLKTKIDEQVNFFTMFNFAALPKSNIYKNNYNFVKNKYSLENKELTNEVFIIGQKLVKSEIVSKDEYFLYLDTIINKYNGYTISYLMHRAEDKNYLVENGYDKKMNILESTKPGELFFLEMKTQPKHIIGSVSALLISLKFIFKNINIISYKFNNRKFLESKEFMLGYENMKQSGIKIYNL